MGGSPSCPQAQQPRSAAYKRPYSLRPAEVSRRNQASREPEEVTNKDQATLGSRHRGCGEQSSSCGSRFGSGILARSLYGTGATCGHG